MRSSTAARPACSRNCTLLRDSSALVRSHAVWALGHLDETLANAVATTGNDAHASIAAALTAHRSVEIDPIVVAELATLSPAR